MLISHVKMTQFSCTNNNSSVSVTRTRSLHIAKQPGFDEAFVQFFPNAYLVIDTTGISGWNPKTYTDIINPVLLLLLMLLLLLFQPQSPKLGVITIIIITMVHFACVGPVVLPGHSLVTSGWGRMLAPQRGRSRGENLGRGGGE